MESAWGARSVNNKPEEYSSSTEREARSIALEKAYVHDVYQQIATHFSDSRYRAWPKVKQFLQELEPGAIVCDVGCGNGKYLDPNINPFTYKIGIDRCSNLTGAAREKNHEVLISDNLNIPFRDDCFDAVVSIAVIHHFATTERRVAALKELARVLRIGGRLMVSVWAMEQRHRRFESQDVLVPWNRPLNSSSDDKTSSIERDLNSTTTTSDDDAATHYHAYTQTSDSEHSFPSCSVGGRKRARIRHRGRSIDPTCPSSSQSSSDLSSPNESCYSFVRRALQKLAGTRRNRGGRRPWFLQGLDIPVGDEQMDHLGSMEEDAGDGLDFRNNLGNQPINNFMPIELRHLESTDFVELFQIKNETKSRPNKGILFSNVLYPRRRRTLETTSDLQQQQGSIAAQPKSKSLSDLFGLIPVGILRSQKRSTDELTKEKAAAAAAATVAINGDGGNDVARSTSSLSGNFSSNDQIQFPDFVRHKAVQTESLESLELKSSSRPPSEVFGIGFKMEMVTQPQSMSVTSTSNNSQDSDTSGKKLRPVLVKQKQSISSPSNPGGPEEITVTTVPGDGEQTQQWENDPVCWGEMKKSVRDLPELRAPSGTHTLQVPRVPAGSSLWKQSSLNEELIFSERLKEKQLLKQNIQKQCSLNEELIYKRRENTRWDQMKEAILNSSNVKCLQLIKNGISNRFRGGESGSGNSQCQSEVSNGAQTPSPTFPRSTNSPQSQASSIRNGIVRMLQNWKGEDNGMSPSPGHLSGSGSGGGGGGSFGARRGSKEGTTRRGLFPPFFLRRSSAGSLNLNKGKEYGHGDSISGSKVLSPPHLKRRPSENELLHEGIGNGNGNKLIPGVRHVRKLSREEGSDSSKDSSFQSDTSVDSEDSFASVIFIPNKGASMEMGSDVFAFNTETRANSTDSDRSPKSPASRLSPPNHNLPKSPSPLASELRRRSPEVSPTKAGLYVGSGSGSGTGSGVAPSPKEVTKFVFDENATKLLSPPQDYQSLLQTQMHVSASPTKEGKEATSPSFKLIKAPSDMEIDLEIELEISNPNPPLQEKSSSSEKSSVSVASESIVPLPASHSHGHKKKVEKIEVLRKPGVLPEGNKVTRQQVRRSLPKSLAVELYNPETDDADTSDTSSSSPNSVSSVVSVVNEESHPTSIGTSSSDVKDAVHEKVHECSNLISKKEGVRAMESLSDFQPTELSSIQEEAKAEFSPSAVESYQNPPDSSTASTTTTTSGKPTTTASDSRKSSSSSILEAAASMVSSLENLVSQSSPKARRKLTLAKLGSTSEWLSSLPTCDSSTNPNSTSSNASSSSQSHHSHSHPPPLVKRSSTERRNAGEKLLLGDVKKYQQKGPDAKWPSSMTEDSPPQTAKSGEEITSASVPTGSDRETSMSSTAAAELSAKLLEEMEEGDSLFDSLENLSNSRQHPSRNPSIDSSVRMSSTCSCSIRGGESFESWSSAKSSMTNSSSTQHKPSLPSIVPVAPLHGAGRERVAGGSGGPSTSNAHRIRYQGTSSKSSSAAGEDTENSAENSTALTYHRYYHVFREGELDRLIEKYVQNLHIISSYYDHANWCIVAEKVQVWTI